jgi:hypothetical protein
MGNLPNPKIVGATFVGLVLVGGAYLTSNFGDPNPIYQTASSPAAVETQRRIAIDVEDRDNNGIEDWRDAFVTNEPIVVTQTTEAYTPPDTLTGKTSIQLLRGLIESKIYAPIAPTPDKVVIETIDNLNASIPTKTFTSRDIKTIENLKTQDVVNYANLVASVVYKYDMRGQDNEVRILQDIVNNEDPDRIPELKAISNIYKNYAEDTLSIPVPPYMAKEHLDLINSYQAVHEDIKGMTSILSDPIQSLAFVQRYMDSTEALRLSLTNIYLSLEPFAEYFEEEDPALLFVLFSPDYQPEL